MTPAELYTGKLLAGLTMGLVQTGIWLLAFWLLIALTTDVLPVPPELQMTLKLPVLSYFVLNHMIGLLTLLTFFGGASSICDNLQDANAVVVPGTMLVLIPFYASFTLPGNPANSLAETLSMFPFTSLYVMPARMALIEVPLQDVAMANILACYLMLRVTTKIYKVGVMSTGRKPSFREVWGWLRSD